MRRKRNPVSSFFKIQSIVASLFSFVPVLSRSERFIARECRDQFFPIASLSNDYDAVRPEIHSCNLFEPQQEEVGVSVPCGCRAPLGSSWPGSTGGSTTTPKGHGNHKGLSLRGEPSIEP